MPSPLVALPILPKGFDTNIKSNFEIRLAKSARLRYLRNKRAWNESKHHALVGPDGIPDAGMITIMPEGGSIANPLMVVDSLAREMRIFANAKTAAELEKNAPETVVGIGQYCHRGNRGYLLVYNETKQGLGFPGGRVRFGQSPKARLVIEVNEEVSLACEIIGEEPVSQLRLGEDGHIFSAYEVEYTGGVPQARPTKEEPIKAIVFVDEPTLVWVCQKDASINNIHGIHGEFPILRNHRRVFLDYIAERDGAKEAGNV